MLTYLSIATGSLGGGVGLGSTVRTVVAAALAIGVRSGIEQLLWRTSGVGGTVLGVSVMSAGYNNRVGDNAGDGFGDRSDMV